MMTRQSSAPHPPDAAKYGTKDKSYRLVTLGADGRVLIWQWHKLDTPVYA